MHIYHLKTCDTCKRAIKALADHDPILIDVRADGVSPELLGLWLEAVGPEVLVNRKSTTWRNLTDVEKASDPLQLLQDHPTLMKRPVIIEGDDIYVGWSKDTQAALCV